MASSSKKKKNMTPGRQRKKAEAQYFDIGKVGRQTGLVLQDTGIRDEHGLEPVTGIFSSPIASPKRNVDKTLSSGDMQMEESSAPDVNDTLYSRKTPRLPPPRAMTPKHTNIGSPKRMSSTRPASRGKSLPVEEAGAVASPSHGLTKTQPPANRKLDFAPNNVRVSIEALSPFRPRKVLRRSLGSARSTSSGNHTTPDAELRSRTSLAKPILEEEQEVLEDEHIEEEALPAPADDEPIMVDDGDEDHDMQAEERDVPHLAEAEPVVPDREDSYQMIQVEDFDEVEEYHALKQQDTPTKQKASRPRVSGASVDSTRLQHTPHSTSTTQSKKRDRTSMESQSNEVDMSRSQMTEGDTSAAFIQKRPRGKPSETTVMVHSEVGDQMIDPSLLAHGDEYVVEDAAEEVSEDVRPSKGKGKGRRDKRAPPRTQEPHRTARATSSPVKLNDDLSRLSKSPDKRAPTRGTSIGPVSNVNLRATTPFEDAGERVSRYGRPVLKPLQYWANETRVWKHGEVEGIIRAEEVIKPKVAKKRKAGRKARGNTTLDNIDEESETESIMADEWEAEVGVIAGSVANWDRATQLGDPNDLIREDLAFAASSIVTRDVANSEFKYAKIMTLPFFGSGIVELPPEGFKRAKNSRKMQMCFFVHEGKVMVEVGAQGAQGEANQFAISKGGVWIVPRGNNYSITNESRTKTARIFFSQGCEVEASANDDVE